MANEKHFVLDRLDAAIESASRIEGGVSARGRNLLDAVQQLRDNVDLVGVSTAGNVDFQAIAQKLITMEAGKAVAKAVGAQELIGADKYETLDPGWIQCLLEYASNRPVDFPAPPVAAGGALYPLASPAENGELKIALAGDWGTKNDPATKIAGHIAEHHPDYTIHLGDVYYAGLPADEKALLVNLWPQGTKGTFALNSNHEMYSGGKGYFETIRGAKWGNHGFSCFALHNNDWLIVGLDTAYFAFYQSWLYEDGYLSDDNRRQSRGMVQVNWLRALLGDAQHAHKRLMILTHHDGFEVKVGGAKKKALYNELKRYVSNDRDCFWYWGHVHGGLVYKPIPLGTNTNLYARCVGHGGVPYAPYPQLSTLGQDEIGVQWAEQENASTGDSRRAWNGYALLTVKGRDITEEFFDENGRKRFPIH